VLTTTGYVNGTKPFLKPPPPKIDTLELIATKFGTDDDVRNHYPFTKFGANPSMGDALEKMTFLTFFTFHFFILMIARRINYFRIHWTDFHNIFTEWKRFGCRWLIWTSFLARDVIYTSRAYATMSVSVRLSVCLSVMEVHWHIIANLGFKFRSQFTAHCGRGLAMHAGAREGIIARKNGSSRTMLAPARLSCFSICQGTLPGQSKNFGWNEKVMKADWHQNVSTSTDSTCIRCTTARKPIAISWSSSAH